MAPRGRSETGPYGVGSRVSDELLDDTFDLQYELTWGAMGTKRK